MGTKHTVLLMTSMLLTSRLGFCLYIFWYSQNRYMARNQENSYIRNLYSTDINLDDLKNILENIKHINETVYQNILQVALKYSTQELLLLLSVGEGIKIIPEKEQQMMLHTSMSRMKNFQEANLTLDGKPKDKKPASSRSLFVREIAISAIPKSEIMNTIKKPGEEKPKSINQERNLPVTPSPRKINEGKNNLPNKPKKVPQTLKSHPCEIDQSLFNGRENVSYEDCSMTLLETRFSKDTLQGGRWFPRGCKPQQRIAIIVPFRDRDRHFKLLLNNLIPKLRRQMVDYTFYVVEQASVGTRFNRGMIRNIGFLEAKKDAKYDCYIFNDADTIIENDLNFYTCVPNSAYHIAVRVDRYKYRHKYKELIGGILGFTEEFFLKTNGYSNFFFIWGGEDDAMYDRVKAVGGKVHRPDFNVSHTTTAKHARERELWERYLLIRANSRFWKKDGLNTLEYQKIVNEKRKLYTWIYVNVNETKYNEMMKNYNEEWKRLHTKKPTTIPTQTTMNTPNDDIN